MKIFYLKRPPFLGKNVIAMNLFGMILARKGRTLSPTTVFHERIHTAQMREMLYVFFYIWYVLEWLVRCVCYFSAYKAYSNISFEREAYENESNPGYLIQRRHYRWTRYL
ncbi:MAG: hypothetical protein J6T04_04070 [Bacteroidales bacterium]|nr:hypothetical protein [Bacteroidales bacterium]